MVTLKKIKIRKIESSIIKGNFGDGKYFGYKKEKLIALTKIYSNTGNIGIGESLVGAYSPILFMKNLNFISSIIKKKNITQTLNALENIQKNKFFFNNGILKSIIASLEIAIINLISEIKCQSFAKTTKEVFFKNQNLKINDCVNVYSSAGSINSNLSDLKRDIIKSEVLNIDKIKIRINTSSDFKSKIDLLRNNIKDFSVDLITNTYEKNMNRKKLQSFLSYIKSKNPLWIEEVLNVNNLENFIHLRQKFKLKFSYGENFNSLNDFVGLIKYYKFDYINPDITHMPISELSKLIQFLKNNNLKKKIIFHCWGSVVNIYSTLQISRFLDDFVKFVELPITDFSLNNEFIEQARINNSKFYFDNDFNSSKYYLKETNIKNSKILKKNSFNFD
tara:strand:- start:14396 stop:15568 length:1173 start_codon:yes stop_codon:yes gene_type:complete